MWIGPSDDATVPRLLVSFPNTTNGIDESQMWLVTLSNEYWICRICQVLKMASASRRARSVTRGRNQLPNRIGGVELNTPGCITSSARRAGCGTLVTTTTRSRADAREKPVRIRLASYGADNHPDSVSAHDRECCFKFATKAGIDKSLERSKHGCDTDLEESRHGLWTFR